MTYFLTDLKLIKTLLGVDQGVFVNQNIKNWYFWNIYFVKENLMETVRIKIY